MAQQRKRASPKPRSRSPQQTVESLRRSLTRECEQHREALEQQAATAEILRVISDSPTDVQPVFEAIVRRATKLCEAAYANVFRYDGERLHWVTSDGWPPDLLSALQSAYPRKPDRSRAAGRVILDKQAVRVEDTRSDPDYDRDLASKLRYRRMLGVPLMRVGEVVGVITVGWVEPGPIEPRYEELLKTFAAQAVIAIENVRLFNETKEALEQQTASSGVLEVISKSPSDLSPVFDAILASATRLCDAHLGLLNLWDGEKCRTVSQRGGKPEFVKWVLGRDAFKPDPATSLARAIEEREPIQILDLREAASVRAGVPRSLKLAELGEARTHLVVPLVKDERVHGLIGIYRSEVRAFTEKQIELVKTFANQAVIAIENVRLFNETKEALEQQTATSQILGVISSSPTALAPVFEAILKSSMQLCDAHLGLLSIADGDKLRTVAHRGGSEEFAKWVYERGAFTPDGTAAQALAEGRPYNIADARDGPGYRAGRPNTTKFVNLGAVRSFLAVPLMKDGHAIGNIGIYRPEVRPFSEKQVALVGMFANQAVIAIENVRLFNETKEALERQTATAEVLKVISRSPSDIQPVFDAVAESAARLCNATDVIIRRIEGGGVLRAVAHIGSIPLPAEVAAIPVSPKSPAGRAVIERRTIHIHDVTEDSMRREYPEAAFMAQRGTGFRTLLVVPLVRNDAAVGTIAVRREEKHPFSDQQIGLLQTFADQAVIAIENVRLFNELKSSNSSLSEALEQQIATADILKVISGSPTDVQPVFEAVAQRAAQLCNAVNASVWIAEGTVLRRVAAFGHSTLMTERPARRTWINGRAFLDLRTVHVKDVLAMLDEYPETREDQQKLGVRTMVAVPMIREGKAVGTIGVWRREVKPFSKSQIELLETFAAQAVIAIENVRLFNETKEALEHQKASADILKIVAGSVDNTDPVFKAITEAGMRLVPGCRVVLHLLRDGQLQHVAHSGVAAEHWQKVAPFFPIAVEGGGVPSAKAVAEKRVVHVPDIEKAGREFELGRKIAQVSGWRSIVSVPLMRAGEAIGNIAITRVEPEPFTDKQIALVQTFADQAVIAIQNARLFNETKEALERQTATSEILRVISSSPTDIAPVFDAILKSATELCGAHFGNLNLRDGEGFRTVAQRGANAEFAKHVSDRGAFKPVGAFARMTVERQAVQVPDLREGDAYRAGQPDAVKWIEMSGARSFLAVPLLKEGQVVGGIAIYRPEVRPFTDQQIALVSTFADQAVIAIENVRLFNELQATNSTLREALEQQTATADILKAISGSPTDVQPVFDTIVRSAVRLGNAAVGFLISYDGTTMRLAAQYNVDPQQQAIYRPAFPRPAARDTMTGRSIVDCTVINLPDIQGSDFGEGPKERARRAGYRSALIVPLLRGGVPIGSLNIQRRETGTFPDSYVALVKTFADQAVIAIENARLFNETKEALERQTATADILKVIAASPADVQPVFDAIIRSASALSGGCSVNVSRLVGDQLHLAAYTPVSPEADELLRSLYPIPATVVRPLSEAVRRKAPFFVSDFENDPGISQRSREVMRARGFRSTLYVPIMRGDVVHGVMHVSKVEPGPFEQKWIDLLQTFADQAVIAIENVRLFNETKEALEQQKASAEVLGAISSSIADTQPVFEKILESCGSLFVGHDSGIGLVGDDNLVHLAAHRGPQAEELRKVFPVPLTRESGTGSAILERAVKHYPDVFGNVDVPSYVRRSAEKVGFKSVVFAPMFWEGRGIGAIWVGRNFAAPFTDKQIALLETFADQAAIAIQNARLFREIQEKSAQLEVASHHKSQFLASMSHELRTPLNAILGFNEMLLDQVYGELSEDVKAPLENMQASGKHLLRLINNVLDLAKIEAGRMELALSDYSVQDTVESVRSTLRPLAVEKGLEFLADVPADIPLAYGDAGRIMQCLMNLAGNSLKFTQAGKVEIAVALNDGTLVYRVADTGIGIPPDKIGSLFTEFKQTDATIASEYGGTGLGLSITKKFIEMHGGRIWVESEPGTGSTFTFEVPLRAGERKAA